MMSLALELSQVVWLQENILSWRPLVTLDSIKPSAALQSSTVLSTGSRKVCRSPSQWPISWMKLGTSSLLMRSSLMTMPSKVPFLSHGKEAYCKIVSHEIGQVQAATYPIQFLFVTASKIIDQPNIHRHHVSGVALRLPLLKSILGLFNL